MSDDRSSPPPQQSGTNDEAVDAALLDSTSQEFYRAVERFHHSIEQIFTFAAVANVATSMSSGELRRRFNRDPEPTDESGRPSSGRPSSALTSGLPPLRSLHRLSMSSTGRPGSGINRYRARILERHREAVEARARVPSQQEVSRTVENTTSTLRTLLELTNNPHGSQPAVSPPLQTTDHPEDSRRKRRKLDSDKLAPAPKAIRYGIYGQVEPGQLTMEIASCDGGVYPSDNGPSYMAENILKNDHTVYCTKSYRCNIVLRHVGSTPFSLKELTIKAPSTSRYSSPVREGMVFVSMNYDDLLTRTAQYQIQYLPSRTSTSGHLPAIYSIRHDDDLPRIRQRAYLTGMGDEDEDCKTAQIPSEFTASPPPFNVVTECSEDHEGDDPALHPSFLRSNRRTPNRIGILPFESDNSDDGADAWGPSASEWSLDDIARSRFHASRARGEHDISNMTLDEAREANQIATQEAVRAVGGGLMAPLARFFIEEDKNKCSIKFDPPVSARFILLKMWSPHHDPSKNIDIQAVVAKGFAGPRYFPSADVR